MARPGPPTSLLVALLIAAAFAAHEAASAPEPAAPPPALDALASDGTELIALEPGNVESLLEADRVVFYEARAPAGGETGTLFIAYHRNRRSLAEPHAPQVCYRASGWTLRTASVAKRRDGATFVAEKGTERRMIYFWYETRGGRFLDPLSLKLDLMRASFAHRPTDALLVRLSGPVRRGESDEQALSSLIDLADGVRPPLRALLAPVR